MGNPSKNQLPLLRAPDDMKQIQKPYYVAYLFQEVTQWQ